MAANVSRALQSRWVEALLASGWVRIAGKIAMFLASVAFFVVALRLIQAGAGAVAPVIRESFNVETWIGALGFGWIAACALLSGSPVAASALSFFDAGEISEFAAFSMITGSRLGAAFVVLLIGFLYLVTRRGTLAETRIGLMALIVTAIVYLPAFLLGMGLLGLGAMDLLGNSPNELASAIKGGPAEAVEEEVSRMLPPWAMFVAGIVLFIVSFKLFDFSLPDLGDDGRAAKFLKKHVYRRWPMFCLGAAITTVSMSVSVSLGLLVPLHTRRIVSIKHLVPYVMGANIMTFADSLLAALTMENSGAIALVQVQMAAVTTCSLAVMLVRFEQFKEFVLHTVDRVSKNLAVFGVFVTAFITSPILLCLIAIALR